MLPVLAESPYQPLILPEATWLELRRDGQRAAAEVEQLAKLLAQQAEVSEAIDLAQDFSQLVRQRQMARLGVWLVRAATNVLEALQRLANGICEDYDAVKAGVTHP